MAPFRTTLSGTAHNDFQRPLPAQRLLHFPLGDPPMDDGRLTRYCAILHPLPSVCIIRCTLRSYSQLIFSAHRFLQRSSGGRCTNWKSSRDSNSLLIKLYIVMVRTSHSTTDLFAHRFAFSNKPVDGRRVASQSFSARLTSILYIIILGDLAFTAGSSISRGELPIDDGQLTSRDAVLHLLLSSIHDTIYNAFSQIIFSALLFPPAIPSGRCMT